MSTGPGGPPHADILFRGGVVYRVDAARSWAQSVAVGGDRILAVGPDADLRGLIGSRTRVIDLAGRMLPARLPGGHVHTSAGGLDRLRCDLTDAEGRDGYLARVARYAAEHPDKEWILGSGWYMDAFPGGIPYRTDLDDVAPQRPV